MTQNELNFLQDALMEKCDKMLISIVNNANAQVKKDTKKQTETKKGENK
jgi:hypothetical protein